MAVNWTSKQAHIVQRLLDAHPVDSNRCAILARELLPVASERDNDAHGLIVTPAPDRGWYVEPKIGVRGWTHHVLVGVEEHGVDALTGREGTAIAAYIDTHWNHVDCLVLARSDYREEAWL